MDWNKGVRKLIEKLTSFDLNSRNRCYKFKVQNKLIGYVRLDVLNVLKSSYDKYFLFDDTNKCIVLRLDGDYESRSKIFHEILSDMRERSLFLSLRGWRNECYSVNERFYGEKMFRIERSAVSIFGIASYGCHINGFVRDDKGDYKIWLARRSKTKQTFPGMLDNLTAGGLTAELGLLECAIKELDEEASINGELLNNLKPVGAISYAYETVNEGIHREGEFCFDIELPLDFVPRNKDGEAESFHLMSVDQVKGAVIRDDFKPNSALVTIHFLIRHGFISPDKDENYFYLLENMNLKDL
jgi:8-oxo-dGTP pyrophosphatase MutT (NUDIX family)